VRAVVEPMIQGETLASLAPDDLRFVIDLGLVRRDADGAVEVANPIYREIIVRSLTAGAMRASLPKIAPTWLARRARRLVPAAGGLRGVLAAARRGAAAGRRRTPRRRRTWC
jgi:hypothetical protein